MRIILIASSRSVQVTWPEELVVQSRTPKRKTHIKSAVPAVAMHPRKNVIHESQRYHRINPFRFDNIDTKLCSSYVSTSRCSPLVVAKHSPISRLADNQGTERALRRSYDDCTTVFTSVRFYALRCFGTSDVGGQIHQRQFGLDLPHT